MRSLPDAEMGNLVPQGGVDADKTADQRKQIERQLEEDEGAEYYVFSQRFPSDVRTLKSLLHIMQHRGVGEFLQDLTICTLRLISMLGLKGSSEFRCVEPLRLHLTFSYLG
jgi:hypothetical protein